MGTFLKVEDHVHNLLYDLCEKLENSNLMYHSGLVSIDVLDWWRANKIQKPSYIEKLRDTARLKLSAEERKALGIE